MKKFGEIIFGLDNHALQKVLRETDWDVICGAIIPENDDVQEKVFSNISARLANLFRHEKECGFGIISEDAQRRIVSTISQLGERGEIIITPETADEIKRFQKESSSELKKIILKRKMKNPLNRKGMNALKEPSKKKKMRSRIMADCLFLHILILNIPLNLSFLFSEKDLICCQV
ncbi:hypothetical protein AGMMS50268_15760 [Spirochaetia bacterium]|nr:hypothetical protein AGMMS50268_15760 [Spirochaetia bacterium]